MNAMDLIRAIGEIDYDMVIDSEKEFKKPALSQKKAYVWSIFDHLLMKGRQNMKKILVCTLCVALCAGLVAVISQLDRSNTLPDDQGGDQSPDRSYVTIFNGYNYEPIGTPDFKRFPALEELSEKTVTGYSFNIEPRHLGEYIGVFPAIDEPGFGEGVAYHFAPYPSYDSIIIVDRNGEYSLYVAHSGALPYDATSTTVLNYYGEPVEIRVAYSENERVIVGDELYTLLRALEGKDRVMYDEIDRASFDYWYAERGDAGVRLVDGKILFDGEEIRQTYIDFTTQNTSHLWLKTDRGFDDIYVYYNPTVKYFAVDHYYYFLTDDEVEIINQLLEK